MEISDEELAAVCKLAFGRLWITPGMASALRKALAAPGDGAAAVVLEHAGWASPAPAAVLIRRAADHYQAGQRDQQIRDLLLEWALWYDRAMATRTDPHEVLSLRDRSLAALGDRVIGTA